METLIKPISQATQHMYNAAYLKIMYIQNDSQGLIHVLGAWEKIFNECVSQNCASQPITHDYFLKFYMIQLNFWALICWNYIIKDW